MNKIFLLSLVVFLVGFGTGTWAQFSFGEKSDDYDPNLKSFRLRDESGKYTNPLLMCDLDGDRTSNHYLDLEKSLNQAVSDAKGKGIDTASIYFRDFNDGSILLVNPDERFIPASLNKVPLMITALNYAEKDPTFLKQKFVFHSESDANAVQMIVPTTTLKTFSEYTVEQAIESMIKYSDNGAYNVLTKLVKYEDYLRYFQILKIPIEDHGGMNVEEYSYFLRALYNSTLLSRQMSEKALGLLAESDYNKALKAGVGADVSVAHKFGVSGGMDVDGKSVDRQLHDCGIVYAPRRPYLLCVMTKSNSDLIEIEQFIAGISRLVFETVSAFK